MRIGELAERTRLTPSAIRYYERIGLLPSPDRTANGYRDYPHAASSRLRFIVAAQAVGLSLDQIREILAFRDRDEIPCAHVQDLIRRRRDEVARAIDELRLVLDDLDALTRRAQSLDPADCRPDQVCHLIPPAWPPATDP